MVIKQSIIAKEDSQGPEWQCLKIYGVLQEEDTIDAPDDMSPGKCELKQQLIPLHIYRRGQNLKHWQHQMLPKMRSNRNSRSLLRWMWDGTATLEDSWAVSYKTKHIPTTQSSYDGPWYLQKGVKHWCSRKNLPVHVYPGFLYNSRSWKQPRCCPAGEWMN